MQSKNEALDLEHFEWSELNPYRQSRLLKLTVFYGALKWYARTFSPHIVLANHRGANTLRLTVGWAAYVKSRHDAMIYLLPSFRGSGIAELLMEEILQFAGSANSDPVTVYPWHPQSIKFFNRFGDRVRTALWCGEGIPGDNDAPIGSSNY